MPRSVNQKPTPLSTLNLSKPQVEKVIEDNVTATSPLPHASTMASILVIKKIGKMIFTGPCNCLQN